MKISDIKWVERLFFTLHNSIPYNRIFASRKNAPGKEPPGKKPPRKLPPWKLIPRNMPPPKGKLLPMKCFLCFYFYENFRPKEKSVFIQLIFYYKFVYSICLHFFLRVYFWFSGMSYNGYQTYIRDQQCWASLAGYTLFL